MVAEVPFWALIFLVPSSSCQDTLGSSVGCPPPWWVVAVAALIVFFLVAIVAHRMGFSE